MWDGTREGTGDDVRMAGLIYARDRGSDWRVSASGLTSSPSQTTITVTRPASLECNEFVIRQLTSVTGDLANQ